MGPQFMTLHDRILSLYVSQQMHILYNNLSAQDGYNIRASPSDVVLASIDSTALLPGRGVDRRAGAGTKAFGQVDRFPLLQEMDPYAGRLVCDGGEEACALIICRILTLLCCFRATGPTLLAGLAWNPVPALLENLECGQGPFWLVPPLATSKITSVTGTSLDAPFLFLLLGCYE
jgi:hypothetical protein